MPKRINVKAGRPRSSSLVPRGSKIIREAIEHALVVNNKAVGFLAGIADGTERSARTLRQDLYDVRLPLKIEAANFLIDRAFNVHLIDHNEHLVLKAVISLCIWRQGDADRFGWRMKGILFMAVALENEMTAAISAAVPRMRADTLRAINSRVARVLETARKRAREAGVTEAYADYIRQRLRTLTRAEKQARIRGFERARVLLGDSAPGMVTDEEFVLLTVDDFHLLKTDVG